VEWIRQYNQSATPEARIHVYGFDMQRYDNNINGLMAYLEQVDPALVEPYRAALADLNDATVFDQQTEKVKAGLQAIQKIRAEMQQKKDGYIAASAAPAFDLADQFAASIEENATLRSGSGSYIQLRSELMAKKVGWIMEYEQQQGRGKVLIAGHTGHIEKSAAAAQYRSMGSQLKATYGDAYFAIGAEFFESTFRSKDAATGERKVYAVKNNHTLNQAFLAAGMEVAYLDIQTGLENPIMQPLLTTPQPMSNIGDSFTAWHAYLSMLYTIKMVPSEAYDAIVFVRSATPTTMLSE
jgi:erythromycin esterase